MTVHQFGGVWGPACVTLSLHRTFDYGHEHAPQFDIRNSYVDDLLLSVDSGGVSSGRLAASNGPPVAVGGRVQTI